MKLVKPNWVTHDGLYFYVTLSMSLKIDLTLIFSLGYPIFSIDIHPDGKRFATGGQGISTFFI